MLTLYQNLNILLSDIVLLVLPWKSLSLQANIMGIHPKCSALNYLTWNITNMFQSKRVRKILTPQELSSKPYSEVAFHYSTKFSTVLQVGLILVNFENIFLVQWDQCSPGNSASHYSGQSIMKLDFLATWVVLDFPKEVPKIILFSEISILCDKNPLKRP